MSFGSLNRAPLELASARDCATIASKDASAESSDPSAYVNDNQVAYYALVNTWLLMMSQYTQYGWIYLREFLLQKGLIETINLASTSSEELIRGGSIAITSPLFKQIIEDVFMPHHIWGVPSIGTEVGKDPMATALMLLRYPKRFSPLRSDKVATRTISEFLATENRSKLIQRNAKHQCTPANFAMWHVRLVMADMMDWDALCDDIERELDDPFNIDFTPGTARDARPQLVSKLRAILRSNPEFFPPVMGVPIVGGMPQCNEEYWGPDGDKFSLRPGGTVETVRSVKVASVPKSYKSSRIIAMEDCYRQGRAHRVFTVMLPYLPAGIKINDQTQNQELSRIGSVDGSVATIDLSSASDTITKSLFWNVFPSRFASLIYPLLGTHHEINGKRRLMQMMATSGNSLTFILESLVFFAIDLAAQQVCESFGFVPDKDFPLPVPSVYGDDQVVWSDVYQTTVEFLQALGFKVNESKSYTGDSPFRESCGTDWYLGVEVSSIYFPRKPIRGKLSQKGKVIVAQDDVLFDSYAGEFSNSLTSLVSLQHRLFNTCQQASMFLRFLIKDTCPHMTSSANQSLAADLWDYIDDCSYRYAPGGREVVKAKCLDEQDPAVVGTYKRKYRYLPATTPNRAHTESALTLERRLYDIYRYHRFLQYGPRYADDNLRMLGVTEPPQSFEEVFFPPCITWRLREANEL